MGQLRALLTKIFVSFVGFGLTFLSANLVSSDEPGLLWTILLAIFVAGVVFVTQFLFEVDRRLAAVDLAWREDSLQIQRSVREGLSKINEATELYGLVEASALRTDEVSQMVKYSATLDSGAPALVREFAQAEIRRVTEVMKALGQGGDLAYEGEDRDWLLALTSNAVDSIDATSLSTVDARGRSFVDGGLWLSDLGQRFLEQQIDAIRRGVRIRRLFILDRSGLASDPEFQSVFESQKSLGIEVRLLDPDTDLRRQPAAALSDFVVFDGVISYEATPATPASLTTTRPVIVNTRLVLQPTRVQERMRRFEALWASGKDIP